MNIADAFAYVKNEQPDFIHISGKTSTGKSTFASKLKEELGYEVIELDEVVEESIIKPLGLMPEAGVVFREIYKIREKPEWIKMFVDASQKIIKERSGSGAKIVIDGAVANITTLQELLAPFPDTKIIFLHPSSLENYERNISSRFMLTKPNYHAGLPLTFWRLVPKEDFEQFCTDRLITQKLSKAIKDFAIFSKNSSERRLNDLQNNFENIIVVEI